jgi:hypothetical protein
LTDAATEDLAVKRTAVKLLSTACDGLLAEDEPLALALTAALRSPNDPLFVYNYRVAETEFRRLPRETTDTLMSRCQSRIAETQDDILAEIRGLRAAGPKSLGPMKRSAPTKKAEPKKGGPKGPITAVEWT